MSYSFTERDSWFSTGIPLICNETCSTTYQLKIPIIFRQFHLKIPSDYRNLSEGRRFESPMVTFKYIFFLTQLLIKYAQLSIRIGFESKQLQICNLKKLPRILFIRVTRNSWLFEKYGCLKSKSENWCLLTTFSKILAQSFISFRFNYWSEVTHLQLISSVIFKI